MTKRKTPASSSAGKEIELRDSPVKVPSTRVDRAPAKDVAVLADGGGRLGALLPTHDIQTTMRPDVTITVSDDEYQQLLAMHLVYSGNPVAPAADSNDLMIADKVSNGTATPAALRAAFVAAVDTNETPRGGHAQLVVDGDGDIIDITWSAA